MPPAAFHSCPKVWPPRTAGLPRRPNAAQVVAGALTSEDAVRQAVGEFADAGCDELVLFPCSPDVDQLRRLADVGLA